MLNKAIAPPLGFKRTYSPADVAAGLSLVKESGGEIFYRCTDGKFKYEVLASNKTIFNKSKELLIKT